VDLESKFNKLIHRVRAKDSVLAALSGGVDSSVVTAIAKIALGDRAVAVTAESMTLPPEELEEAKKLPK